MGDFKKIRTTWFSDKILELEKSGISQAEIARRMGVKPQYLSPILRGDRNASEELVLKLCEGFDINQNDLVSKMRVYETDYNFVKVEEEKLTINKDSIPLIPVDVMAGKTAGDVSVSETDIIDHYVVPEFKSKGVQYLIRVSGSSMYPKYSNGDLLACRPLKDMSFFQWGKAYVLDTEQGPIVKRLFPCKDDDYLECHSDNSEHYPAFKIPKSAIRAIALVIGVIRLE